MKFTDEDLPYLTGEKLATVRTFRIANPENRLPSRCERLVARLAGKKVIDLGCTDHIETIDEKIENGTWLHQHIAAAASRCIGFDINAEAVDHVRETHGYANIHCYDFFDAPVHPDLSAEHWDYLLMGEILEHIDNPVQLLSSLREKYSEVVDRIILTVPNAFKLPMVKDALFHRETNNTDHRYCFTPFTLAKVVTRAGLAVEEFEFCHLDVIPDYGIVKKLIYSRFPAFRNNLLLVAKF